jgi:predicted SAM-dependent methyltransferase
MNFVDYTLSLIKEFGMNKKTLVVGAGFGLKKATSDMIYKEHIPGTAHILQNEPDEDLAEWIEHYRNSSNFELFDNVILSRVFEHFPARHVDWYLYSLYTIMKKGGKLICIVPDMEACAKELIREFSSTTPVNLFRVNRLNYELLSEGDHVWDRHATWTSLKSMMYYLEMEGLFKVETIDKIKIDSDIVPKEIKVIAIRR